MSGAHEVELCSLIYVTFSSAVDAMPPLPQTAGYWTTWGHNMLQTLSLNFSRIKRPLA